MNRDTLRRWAASLYALAEPGEVRKARPLPGNELTLQNLDGSRWSLTLRREENPLDGEDLQAVAEAFVLPEGCEPALRQAVELNKTSGRSVPVFYARWSWSEVIA